MRRRRQIALLGYPGVGKSSLAHHFVYKQFETEYDPNIKTNLEHRCVFSGEEYDLIIVDNAGFDQYTLNHNDFDNSDAYILVYAIDDRQSFEMVTKIREKIFSTSTSTRIPMVLVGNKIDRKDERMVSVEEGQLLAQSWDVHFIEASAMDLKTVQQIFERSVNAMDDSDKTSFDQGQLNIKAQTNEKNPPTSTPTPTTTSISSSSSTSKNGLRRPTNGNSSSKNPCVLS